MESGRERVIIFQSLLHKYRFYHLKRHIDRERERVCVRERKRERECIIIFSPLLHKYRFYHLKRHIDRNGWDVRKIFKFRALHSQIEAGIVYLT